MIKHREDTIRKYEGDKKGLVDALYADGDLEGASNVVKFETDVQKLSKAQQETMQQELGAMSAESLNSSGAVLEAFSRDPREGMEASMKEAQRLAGRFPKMAKMMPNFNQMPPQEALSWWTNKYNRSSKNREFTERKRRSGAIEAETQRHNIETERATSLRARATAQKGYKKTKSDRQMELANKIANKKATPEEIEELDILNRTDPLDIAMRQAVKRAGLGGKAEPEVKSPAMITVGNKEYELVEELEDGRKRIRDPKTGKTGIVK